MREDYGVTGGVAEWMQSYLSNRHQSISINGTLSDKSSLDFGYPQGSALGPFGLKLYTKPITAIARKHVQIHLYADDTQLYLPFQQDQSEEAMKRLNACVEDIRQWMENNFEKLNDTKKEFIILGTPKNVGKVVEWIVDVGDAIILLSGSVRNIGAILNLTFNIETLSYRSTNV